MADFTLNRTIEDRENELYELSYKVEDIAELEKDTPLGRAYGEWRVLVSEGHKASHAANICAVLEKSPDFSDKIHRVCCSVAGTEFDVDESGRKALRQIGIPDTLDLTARQLNNRSFATFLFFANSIATPTYQRVSEICSGTHREYARLALPAGNTGDPIVYFMTRSLEPAELALDKIREITE